MTYEPPPHLWVPQRRGFDLVTEAIQNDESVCMYAPTGGGKTVVAAELLKWADYQGWGGIFFINRKLLIQQTSRRFDDMGISHGVRAADFDDKKNLDRKIQISSVQTEESRVYRRKKWKLHPAHVVIVDEAHIQKGPTMRKILADYRKMGACVVLLTATPIGISGLVDRLIVSGTLEEYRECRAVVPARVFSVETPDMRKIKRNQVGEYVMDGERKKIYIQSIVANVIQWYKDKNPAQLPTMMYAPGKEESVWLTEQFEHAGIPWAHIDATDACFGGNRHKLTRTLWDDLTGMYRDGTIRGFSSRFKLREGIDEPSTGMCILATPIGSLASYIQTVGRVLRYSDLTPDEVIITDHGGNYLRHGSPNWSRDWEQIWDLPEGAVNRRRQRQIADGEAPEPIRCPECGGERNGGRQCPHCKFIHAKSMRHVLMEDGTLELKEGPIIPRRRFVVRPDTQRLWDRLYYAFKRKGTDRSFAQMMGFFHHEHGYCPPKTLNNMPTTEAAWYSKVCLVPDSLLRRSH